MNSVFKFKAGDQIIEKGGAEFRRKARIVGAYRNELVDHYKIFWIDAHPSAPQFEFYSRELIEDFYELNK